MSDKWRFNRLRDPLGILGVLVVWLLFQNLSLCWCLNDEGLALLRFRERVVSDPFGALSNWNDEDGEVDPCSWFGVECSDGKVVVLNLKDLCLGGALSPELRNLVHIKSIILRNNTFMGIIPGGFGELKELEVLDLGYNNFSGPLPIDLGSNFSLTILLLDNRLLGTLSPEIFALEMLSRYQVDENQLSGATRESYCNERSHSWYFANTEHSHHGRLLEAASNVPSINSSPSPSPSVPPKLSPTSQPTTPAPQPSASSPSPSRGSSSRHVVIMAAAIGGGASLVILVVGLYLYGRNKVATVKPWATRLSGQLQKAFVTGFLVAGCNRKGKRQQGIQNSSLESKDGRRFMYSELVKITNNFASPIGAGGFGKVYHGVLENNDQVAVKLLISASGSNEFQNEVKLLMRAHHRNVVSFTGYCNDLKTMALVFKYVANGNLQQHLTVSDVATGNILTWKERLQIAVDAARGLEYLHNGCTPPIIHRDIKTSNILLTEKMQAKICDFGVSKLLSTESATHTMTDHVKGTRGYFDPEYYTTGKLNKKSDIYSFGIVLLELITGRTAIITDVEPEPIHICEWVRPMLERGDIESIVDSRIQAGTYNVSSAWKAVGIATECVSSRAIKRPDIIVVYKELKECLEIEIPPEIAKVPEVVDESDVCSPSSSVSVDMTSHTQSDSILVRMKSHIESETERHTC